MFTLLTKEPSKVSFESRIPHPLTTKVRLPPPWKLPCHLCYWWQLNSGHIFGRLVERNENRRWGWLSWVGHGRCSRPHPNDPATLRNSFQTEFASRWWACQSRIRRNWECHESPGWHTRAICCTKDAQTNRQMSSSNNESQPSSLFSKVFWQPNKLQDCKWFGHAVLTRNSIPALKLICALRSCGFSTTKVEFISWDISYHNPLKCERLFSGSFLGKSLYEGLGNHGKGVLA